jgi:dUTP pyrophosphatase
MPKNTFFASVRRYEEGDRVGQLIILPYPKVDMEEVTELSDTERGDGGFGSSGK